LRFTRASAAAVNRSTVSCNRSSAGKAVIEYDAAEEVEALDTAVFAVANDCVEVDKPNCNTDLTVAGNSIVPGADGFVVAAAGFVVIEVFSGAEATMKFNGGIRSALKQNITRS
jgi:hypothetical protein